LREEAARSSSSFTVVRLGNAAAPASLLGDYWRIDIAHGKRGDPRAAGSAWMQKAATAGWPEVRITDAATRRWATSFRADIRKLSSKPLAKAKSVEMTY
jgi:hypothetical protein